MIPLIAVICIVIRLISVADYVVVKYFIAVGGIGPDAIYIVQGYSVINVGVVGGVAKI